MEIIKEGTYNAKDIAELVGVNPNQSKPKRAVVTKLKKLGYLVADDRKHSITIIKSPDAIEDETELQKIMQEKFNMDVRIDTRGFALHTASLLMDENYCCMPNEKRSEWLREAYGIDVCAQTISNWTGRLVRNGNVKRVSKDNWQAKTYWMTEYIPNVGKVQTEIKWDDPGRKAWWKTFWEHKEKYGKQIGKFMWDKTGRFYFSCLPFETTMGAWGNTEEQENFFRLIMSITGSEFKMSKREEPIAVDIEMSDEEYEALYGEQTAEPQTQSATKVEEEYEDPWFMRDEAPAPANSKSSSSCFTEEQKAYMAKISLPDVPRCIWKEWLASGIAIESEDDNDLIIKVETAEVFRKSGWR